MTEDAMVGWHHPLDGHKFEPALGVGDGQGSLECWSVHGVAESDTTEQLNNNSHPYMTTEKTIALTRRTFVGKVMSLLFNKLSRLVITFLPRSVF